jgi:hypothetical protein
VKDAWWYVQKNVVDAQGASDYSAPNPPFGATFTYYLKEEVSTFREKRASDEKKLEQQNADIPFPGWDVLEKESLEDKPALVFTVRDENGNIVNNIMAPAIKGIHRVHWNLRYASRNPIGLEANSEIATSDGFLATPGTYSVAMTLVEKGKLRQLSGANDFQVVPLHAGALPGAGYDEFESYRREVEIAQQKLGKVRLELNLAQKKIAAIKQAYFRMDQEVPGLLGRIYDAEREVQELDRAMNGTRTKSEIGEKQVATPADRISVARSGLATTYGPTALHKESLGMGIRELDPIQLGLVKLLEEILPGIESELKNAGAPWVEGQDL